MSSKGDNIGLHVPGVNVPSKIAVYTSFGGGLTRRVKGMVNRRTERLKVPVVLTPNLGVRQGPLGKQRPRCFSRSPCLTKVVTKVCDGKVRRIKATSYVGRFITGGYRADEGQGRDLIDRQTLHRVCFGTFRCTVRIRVPTTMVATCGTYGKGPASTSPSLVLNLLERRGKFSKVIVAS